MEFKSIHFSALKDFSFVGLAVDSLVTKLHMDFSLVTITHISKIQHRKGMSIPQPFIHPLTNTLITLNLEVKVRHFRVCCNMRGKMSLEGLVVC